MEKKGTISIQSENIFPVIKKFLYSDCDVFLRELVSNAVDASQKLKQLASMGQYNKPVDDLKIKISIDEEKKTLTISDMGLGMDADEVEKYINQVAFSGATDFVNKYQNQGGDKNQLIGFFGLGFYSAFMVSDKVDIVTKSYKDGSEPVFWTCDGSTSFEIRTTEKESVGTDIILHINKESEDYLKKYKISDLLNKYCKFLPIPIFFDDKQVNNTSPIWVKHPQDLKDDDYKNFYRELYPYSEEPLFWLHLNIDYPFNLTGILYFPAGLQNIDFKQEKIHLYSHQVFITEDLKDIVPVFLTLLHGVIDSPDIPLNVSRSALQADRNVKSINTYITKKFADKLYQIFKDDRKGFEDLWAKIEVVVKYGMLTEPKFLDQVKDYLLLKNVDGKYFTVNEFIDKVKDNQTDKDNKVVILYSTDVKKQDMFIQSCKSNGYDVIVLEGQLDIHMLTILESRYGNVVLKCVDSCPIRDLIKKDSTDRVIEMSQEDQDKLKDIFVSAVGEDRIHWTIEQLSSDDMPVVATVNEDINRLRKMEYWQKGGINNEDIKEEYNAVINVASSKIKDLLSISDIDKQKQNARIFYDLSLLSQGKLIGKDLTMLVKDIVGRID